MNFRLIMFVSLAFVILNTGSASAALYAYVTNEYGSTVSVIDLSTNTVVDTITIGSNPRGIDVDSDRGRAYVGVYGTHNLTVIDTSTNTIVDNLTLGYTLEEVAVDHATGNILVAGYGGGVVYVVDPDTLTVSHTITVGTNPFGIAIDENLNRAYVSNYGSASISVIDLSTFTVLTTITGTGHPRGIAVYPDRSRVYVANWGGNTVTFINSTTNTVIKNLAVSNYAADVAVDYDTDKIFVTRYISSAVSVISASTETVSTSISTGSWPRGIGVDADTSTVYALRFGDDIISVINASTNTVTTSISNGDGPANIGFLSEGHPAPTANFTATPLVGAPPFEVDFTDTSTETPTSWYWDFGDGNTSTDQNPSHTYYSTGSFNVSLQATNAYGSDWENKTDHITGYDQIVCGFEANMTYVLLGDAIKFTDTSIGEYIDTWTWDIDDDGVVDMTTENATVYYGTMGYYTVSHTVSSSVIGSSDTETKTNYVQVVSGPGCVACNFSANVTSGQAPLTVQFGDLSTGTPDAWYWDFGDGYTSTDQNPVHTYSTAGSFDVEFTATNTTYGVSRTKTKTDLITVTAAGELSADFEANVTYGNTPLIVKFIDVSTGVPVSWYWDFGDGYTSTDQNPVHTYTESGIYTISLTVVNSESYDTKTKVSYIQVYGNNYGGIYGYIYDSSDSSIVTGATAIFSNATATANMVTGTDGSYYFWPVYNGVYNLSVSKNGYDTISYPNTIINGTTTRFDVYMTPDGSITEGINITVYSTDWLEFSIDSDTSTYTMTLDYEVTDGTTEYANFTVISSEGVVYTSNITDQSNQFSYTGTSGKNYVILFSVANSNDESYTGAFPVIMFRGLPTGYQFFPDDYPQWLINCIVIGVAVMCLLFVGPANEVIGLIMCTGVITAGYAWGMLDLGGANTKVIISILALMTVASYMRMRRITGDS